MDYSVRVKPGHPTGVRRRGGQVFGLKPTTISAKEMTKEIREDPWLIATEAKGETKPDDVKKADAGETAAGKEGKKSLLDRVMGT